MNIHNKNTVLHLSLMYGIGPAVVVKLITYVAQSTDPDLVNPDITNRGTLDFGLLHDKDVNLSIIYTYTVTDFVKNIGLSIKTAQQLVDGLADRTKLDEECALIKQYSIDILTIFDPTYPEDLRQIHYPPLVLYCKGSPLEKTAKRMAIVGSRKASGYAQRVITTIVPDLIAHGWTIVSGGAEGVDSMAHQATLDNKGKTVVVLGSGLMQPYPESNKELFKSVIRNGGTLVTSFSLNTAPERGNFPARNRIIAGLSQGCVVVQAAEKSGALITAKYALEQGRQIFALPGSIFEPLSAGCHILIKQGAKLVNNMRDILEEFGVVEPQTGPVPVVKQKVRAKLSKNIEIHRKLPIKLEETLDPVLQLIDFQCTLDELSDKTGLSLPELHNKLFELQLEGKVRQTFSGAWERCE